MDLIVYHAADDAESRAALALIRHAGLEPHVIAPARSPPAPVLLDELARRARRPLATLLRAAETRGAGEGLATKGLATKGLATEGLATEGLATAGRPAGAAPAEEPGAGLRTPLVVSPLGVKLCRPAERVLDLLPVVPATDLDREDGAPFLREEQVAATEPRLAKALREAGLPTQDLRASPGRFFAFRTLGGRLVGYGGYEAFGPEALLRSVLVRPEFRGRGAGRAMVRLLTGRAGEDGAERAWLLTQDAAGFFERLGFAPVAREAAPAAIRQTPQAASLCPASARLLGRILQA
ncbi:arsenic resistance N-acetyltransferase ArsN2 [Ancylobacter lacus]|uniref:arsenic resistance N-acetyltransferase ArsN2 n=1 Tax=Ancylobacter lacus TaxID=2579970 RepID=UPI001BCC8BE4|nr:arsenic resistance N-acetyltransferase ArsN2 [Ancylobacter lacus]MBS7540018.1 GNAT family N-acetyltransferase [Ancylobacter lacus]